MISKNDKIIDKTILITGAAGSIGGQLTRSLIELGCTKLLLLDIAESPLYDLQQSLFIAGFKDFKLLLVDIKNTDAMESVLKEHQPEIIYHTAAYKHVPMMEENPLASVETNLKATIELAKLSEAYNVEKFILISTDKAVEPSSIMGATKSLAEKYLLNLISNKTKYIITRFGNVLDSSGSVIPLFEKQIENKGPITLTHKDVSRYFMTITEASQLVVASSVFGVGGEIFIFDMGASVKVIDLAKELIAKKGFKASDIEIKLIGLRPGEKLTEVLVSKNEALVKTKNDKIFKVTSSEKELRVSNAEIEKFIEASFNKSAKNIVNAMKAILPDFISENTKYEYRS